ncbi:hypothetical protein [Methylobacterium sp. E-046]|uniref:hypothetical protein n=1 Tax=Methylobacterium sp. E-046 TaxID=2836576 RepID=UPI001FB94028|nr:hypothetical protein [Methylobacterium sp. E-046]MCJ2102387.1 hypothetical protein [Methylobacterium sp. E-046]
MSGGPSFLGDLGGFDLQSLLDQLRQAPQGGDPQAAIPAPTMGLNPFQPTRGAGDVDPSGRGTGPVDQRRPSIAMDEGQVQTLERAQAGPADAVALGGSPLDRLLFDRSGFGGGSGGFAGAADPYATRAVPLPPTRPGDDALMVQPSTTGTVSGMNPGGAGAMPPKVKALSDYPGGPAPAAPADPVGVPQMPPANSFDPLTGQVVSGQPQRLGGAPSPAPAPAGPMAPALGQGGPQPSMMEQYARAVGAVNPQIGDLLFHVGLGIASNRGIGPGIAAGLQSYGSSQSGSLKGQLEQIKFMQEQQGQQDTYNHLVNNLKYDPTAARAAMRNPTLLTNLLQQQTRAPNTVDYGGVRYLVPPNSANDPSQWQRVGTVNGPQPGFEADPNNPGGERPVVGGQADPNYKAAVAGAEARAKDDAVPDKLINTRPGAVLYDPNTRQPVYTAPGNKPEGFETEDKLRTEFSKQLGTFGQVHEGYGRVIAATRQRETNPGQVSPASDMSLVFGYMKMLDPGSVVREGEYATAKNAAGVPEQVLNAYNKARNGEFLSDRQRQDFLGQAQELYGTARHTADGVAERYRGLAQQYGVSPDRSVYMPESPTPPKLGQQSQPSGSAAGRFQELMTSGMSKADAFARMRKEGL